MNVKTTLLLSLNQDIRTINKLLEEVTKAYDPGELKSWLFPTQHYNFTSKFIYSTSFRQASYEHCLEITVDLLYVLICCCIRFIETKNPSSKGLVIKPSRLTLGLCAKMLWENIQVQMDKESSKNSTYTPKNHKSTDKQSQTEIVALNRCDSCSSAIVCMKTLLKYIDDHQQDRVKINYQLFDITQFGAMLEVTSSIEKTLSSWHSQFQQAKTENKSLKSENGFLTTKLQQKKMTIALLEEEVSLLRKRSEIDSISILALREEQSRLIEDSTSKGTDIKTQKDALNQCNISLQVLTKQNEDLKSYNIVAQSSVQRCLRLLKKCNTSIRTKQLKLDEEHENIKSIINEYDKSITLLNIRLVKITKNVGKTEFKLTNCTEDAIKMFTNVIPNQNFCTKIKELFYEKVNKGEAPLKGNPMEDISRQIETNKKKINDLEAENIKLQRLLSKFKNIELMK